MSVSPANTKTLHKVKDPLLPVYLSYGMGIESTAALLRWIHEPASRHFDLSQLTVMTSMTGDEYGDTKRNVQKHILPLLSKHRIRYVQIARNGHAQADGITVLSDTRQPRRLFMRGPFTLFNELTSAGTVPQFGSVHKCSLKFKVFPLTEWMKMEIGNNPCYHAFGYNAEESDRIIKSEEAFTELNKEFAIKPTHYLALGYNAEETSRIREAQNYDVEGRIGFYPLQEWGWTRQDCDEYVYEKTGQRFLRSCCVECPFARVTEDSITRWLLHPRRTARALLLERISLALNPKGTLFKNTTLHEILAIPEAHTIWKHYESLLTRLPWAIYRVRRIYTAKGKADRCVELIKEGTRSETQSLLNQADYLITETHHDAIYKFKHKPIPDTYPTIQEFLTACPALPQTKARYGIEWFDEKWEKTTGSRQPNLFA